MSAEVDFFSNPGTPDAEYLGCAYGADNAIRACAFTDEELTAIFPVKTSLALVRCFPDEDCVDRDLQQKLEALPKNTYVKVSIDY